MPDDLEQRLIAFAERTMRIKTHCLGEDATRIYLVMPFLELLGYDARDPSVIVPEHEDAISFAVMVDGNPSTAIETTGADSPPTQAHRRLRAYCETVGTVKLGIATNGVLFEVFIDSQRPYVLDDEPFVRVDLAQVAARNFDRQMLALLHLMCASFYDPGALAERAFAIRLAERLKACLLEEFRNPSEAFCRLLLGQAGISNAKPAVIDQHYRPILKTAMEQAIVVPVVKALRQLPPAMAPTELSTASVEALSRGDSAPDRLRDEVAAFGRMKRRIA